MSMMSGNCFLSVPKNAKKNYKFMNSFQCTRLKGKLSQLKEGGNVVSPDEIDKVRECRLHRNCLR